MTGAQVRRKIKEKGYSFRNIARALGISDQSLRQQLLSDNVKSGLLEQIAEVIHENVAYFYNERPIFTLADYVEYETIRRENQLLKQIIQDKEALIEALAAPRK